MVMVTPLTPVAAKLDLADIWLFIWIVSSDSDCPAQLPYLGKGTFNSEDLCDDISHVSVEIDLVKHMVSKAS
jgi:hypothetical protein